MANLLRVFFREERQGGGTVGVLVCLARPAFLQCQREPSKKDPLSQAAAFSSEGSTAIIGPLSLGSTQTPNKSIVPGYIITIRQHRFKVAKGKDPSGGGESRGEALRPSPWS